MNITSRRGKLVISLLPIILGFVAGGIAGIIAYMLMQEKENLLCLYVAFCTGLITGIITWYFLSGRREFP